MLYGVYGSSGKEMEKVLSSGLPVQTEVCILQAKRVYALCHILVAGWVWFEESECQDS